MIVIYKLFVIGELNIITDIVNYIKNLWIVLEMIVIEPPSLEEWESNKVFDPHPIDFQTGRYVLVKNNIMYIELTARYGNTGTYLYLADVTDPIIYGLTDISLGVNFHKSSINPNKLYYNKKLLNGTYYSNQIVTFYYFHCNI